MLGRISQSCPLTVTSLLSVTTREAMFTPSFLRNRANGPGFPYRFQHYTYLSIHCCMLRLVGPTSPASQLPENRKKKRLIPPMLGDRYRTFIVRRPFTKQNRYSSSACSIAYTDKVSASKHIMNFSAFFICLRSNSAGRPKHARVEHRVKLSNTLQVS